MLFDPRHFQHENALENRTGHLRARKNRQAEFQGIREIIEKIVIYPRGRYEPIELEIFGQLVAILKLSDRPRGLGV